MSASSSYLVILAVWSGAEAQTYCHYLTALQVYFNLAVQQASQKNIASGKGVQKKMHEVWWGVLSKIAKGHGMGMVTRGLWPGY